jgi:hypothetical protein
MISLSLVVMVTPAKSIFQVMPDYRQMVRRGLDGYGDGDACNRCANGAAYCRENHFLRSVALKKRCRDFYGLIVDDL